MAAGLRTAGRVVRSIGGFLREVTGTAVFACAHVAVLRRPAIAMVFHKQVLFTAIQALLPVAVAGLAVGIGLVTQMRSLLGSGVELNVKMLQLVVLREFAPLLTAFIVLGRSGSAMATELAAMKVRGEIRALYLAGISPGEYLLVPRVIGCAVAVPVLTFVCQLVAAGAGPAVASVLVEMELRPFLGALLGQIRLPDVVLSLVKTFVFGLVIASIACTTGLYVPQRRVWVPQAAEISVLRGFIMLLLVDLGFAALSLLGS